MAEWVTVDEDVLKFLRIIYFGSIEDVYRAAGTRAYLDMNRTIRFCGMPEAERERLRAEGIGILKQEIRALRAEGEKDGGYFFDGNEPAEGQGPGLHRQAADQQQERYDLWHEKVCSRLRETYRRAGVTFYYGQAQKWVNMTWKYLYILGEEIPEPLFACLHVPVDNYIFDAAKRRLAVERPKICWSRWDSYEEQYLAYQKRLREKIIGAPLRWEFDAWAAEVDRQ